MFTIKKKPLTPNMIWDGSAGKILCNFGRNGTIATNDQALAEKLAALGHEVTREADGQQEGAEGPELEVEPQADQEAGQLEDTAEAPVQQAAAPAAKGRRNRK